MKRKRVFCVAVTMTMVALTGNPAMALPPPPSAPFTLWNFLGIPQGMNKIKDATSNRRGNRPNRERLPPMKAIADPANLASANPAIKAAAEIKTQEDMAPQKIKAIKYLATIGCGCYPDVKEALMAALEDCTEEVRYQAALAIQDATTQHCQVCNQNCCCDQELTLKLSQRAFERNDKGCFIEPSERVREACRQAMCACCPGGGPIDPEQVPTPEVAPPTEGVPTPPPTEGEPTPPPPAPEGASVLNMPQGTTRSVSARRMPPVSGSTETVRVYENRTKIIMPDGTSIISDEGEQIEAPVSSVASLPKSKPAVVVTEKPAEEKVPSAKVADATVADEADEKATEEKVADATATDLPEASPVALTRSALSQPAAASPTMDKKASTAPQRLPKTASKSTPAAQPLGKSSRRAAVERGLAKDIQKQAPPTQVAMKVAEPKPQSPSTPPLAQPKKVLEKILGTTTATDTKSTAPRGKASDEAAKSSRRQVGEVSAVAYAADSVSLAPKAGPPIAEVSAVPVRKPVQGLVTRVSVDANTIEVRVPRDGALNIGDRLKVTHEYMLESNVVGYVEVVSIGPRGATTRPVGDLKLTQVSRGDEVAYEPTSAAPRVSRNSGKPNLAVRSAGQH